MLLLCYSVPKSLVSGDDGSDDGNGVYLCMSVPWCAQREEVP